MFKTGRFWGLLAVLLFCLGAAGCGAADKKETADDALSWVIWGGYDSFWELLAEREPDIAIDFVSYNGANYTGYSWAQLRADDITDLFSTSQILDRELAAERLVDLSGYDFINGLSTGVLDQVAIDGGIYLLPVSNAVYGILYNKTLMAEHDWQVPSNFAELEALCSEIREAGLTPGIIGTQLTGNTFSAVFNLAKTSWLTTPEGISWEQAFLAGQAAAAGVWEPTMAYVQKYIDIGMFTTDPDDISNVALIEKYLAGRQTVFFTMAALVDSSRLSNGDELGMMPYIGEDGSKNIYMYNPTSYIGISKRLLEPGNEAKLEKAIRVLSLLYSPEGQAAFVTEATPCVMHVLRGNEQYNKLPENSLIAQVPQAMREGRVFPMTYAGWEGVLSDMGQAYKEWFRGERGMDGAGCIARMDELQQAMLENPEQLFFCESTGNFSIEETAKLVGSALGSAIGVDAVLVPYADHYTGVSLKSGITGKLYADRLNIEISNTICPSYDGEYAVMTMTGEEAKALAQAGFAVAEGAEAFPYLLVTKADGELADGAEYQVGFLMNGYTPEIGVAYGAQVYKGSLRDMLRQYLTEKKQVYPGMVFWE